MREHTRSGVSIFTPGAQEPPKIAHIDLTWWGTAHETAPEYIRFSYNVNYIENDLSIYLSIYLPMKQHLSTYVFPTILIYIGNDLSVYLPTYLSC